MRARRTATAWPSPRWHRWKLTVLLGVILLLKPVGGVWELEQLWVEDIREYVEKYTGDLDEKGTAIDSKFLRFEQTGWYQKLYDRTSVGMDKVRGAWDRRCVWKRKWRLKSHEQQQQRRLPFRYTSSLHPTLFFFWNGKEERGG